MSGWLVVTVIRVSSGRGTRPRQLKAAGTLFVFAIAAAPATPASPSPPFDSPIRGMTVSAPRGTDIWGSDEMVATIAELQAMGVNWIAIHPYARIGGDGTVSVRDGGGEAPGWLRRPIAEAHRRGMRIMIKPHLAYWGTFAWAGDITFDTDAEWQRFFSGYRAWITTVARWSEGADAFVIGTELDRTVEHADAWERIIADVRGVYDGQLTYAANWTDFERVPFWRALDAIGIQAYFPLLPESATAGGRLPAAAEFDAAWAGVLERLHAFEAGQDRPVVFTELGYNLSAKAPHEPWDWDVGGTNAEQLQEACMRAALRALAGQETVRGAFLWKWFPGDRQPRNFAMSSPAMRRVIAEHWLPSAGTGE